MHLNSLDNWSACLFVSDERWEIWPVGAPFLDFLKIPVHNFFLGQAHFAAHGYWPDHRERPHENAGIVQYYQEKFNCQRPEVIYQLLKEAEKSRSAWDLKCPCDFRTPLRKCSHGDIVKQFREHQDPKLLSNAILIFKNLIYE